MSLIWMSRLTVSVRCDVVGCSSGAKWQCRVERLVEVSTNGSLNIQLSGIWSRFSDLSVSVILSFSKYWRQLSNIVPLISSTGRDILRMYCIVAHTKPSKFKIIQQTKLHANNTHIWTTISIHLNLNTHETTALPYHVWSPKLKCRKDENQKVCKHWNTNPKLNRANGIYEICLLNDYSLLTHNISE